MCSSDLAMAQSACTTGYAEARTPLFSVAVIAMISPPESDPLCLNPRRSVHQFPSIGQKVGFTSIDRRNVARRSTFPQTPIGKADRPQKVPVEAKPALSPRC